MFRLKERRLNSTFNASRLLDIATQPNYPAQFLAHHFSYFYPYLEFYNFNLHKVSFNRKLTSLNIAYMKKLNSNFIVFMP
jgi:hypothetical protein